MGLLENLALAINIYLCNTQKCVILSYDRRYNAMGKPLTAAKNRYNTRTYDRLSVFVPKWRKRTLELFLRERKESLNGMTNRLYMQELGIDADEWRRGEQDG